MLKQVPTVLDNYSKSLNLIEKTENDSIDNDDDIAYEESKSD
jgi:hypothetical protein